MKRELLESLLEAQRSKRAAVLATDLDSGEARLIWPDDLDGEPLAEQIRTAVRADRSTTVEEDGRRWFLHVYNPPLRMLIVGAVHIAQPLSRMAALAGYDVTVVDPRRAFASEERFPGVHLSDAWPDEALEALQPDARTAVVTLTHDPKLDDPALAIALRSPTFYIGALGSTRTHAKRLDRLRAEGLAEDVLERIHGPIGLAIGARSPAEIAVAILAQVTETLRKGAA